MKEIHKEYVINFSNHCQVITHTQSNFISFLFIFFLLFLFQINIFFNKYGISDANKTGVLYKDQALGSEFKKGT